MIQGLLHWAWTIIRSPLTIYEGWRQAWRESTMCDVCLYEGSDQINPAVAVCRMCGCMYCNWHRDHLYEGNIARCCEGYQLVKI